VQLRIWRDTRTAMLTRPTLAKAASRSRVSTLLLRPETCRLFPGFPLKIVNTFSVQWERRFERVNGRSKPTLKEKTLTLFPNHEQVQGFCSCLTFYHHHRYGRALGSAHCQCPSFGHPWPWRYHWLGSQ
jgi:hypothetical protein